MVYLCGRPLPQSWPLHARPRDGDSADDVGRGWLAAHDGRGRHADASRCRRRGSAAAADRSTPPVARTSTPTSCRSTFSGCARRSRTELFSLQRAAGSPASLRPRDDRQPVRAGTGRAAPAGALLQRVDASWSSSREHFQQMAGLVCYYNSAKFHYFYVSTTTTAGKHLRVMSALPDQVQRDAFTPPIAIPTGAADRAARRSGLRAAALRVSNRRRRVAMAAAAVRRQHPLGRGQRARVARISPARSSAWRARISPGRRCRLISIGSSTASAST